MLLDLSKPFDVNKASTYFEKLKKDGAKIEIRKIEKTRTLNQNNYLYACLGIYSIESGYEIEELKSIFALELPELLIYEKNGYKFRRSTSDLSTPEMAQLIDYIRRHANENLGLYIPDATEYLINRFQIDRDIQDGR